MAEAIGIPSPFYRTSAADSPVDPPTSRNQRHPPIHSTKPQAIAGASPITKRKQSKSRNGCSTCKAKRLKCDETKPTCQQCTRRGVPCGGYKKDFKWRAFDDASFQPAHKPSTRTSSPNDFSDIRYPPAQTSTPTSAFQNVFVEYRPYASDLYAMSNAPAFMTPPASLLLPDQFDPISDAHTPRAFADADAMLSPEPALARTTAPSSTASGQSPRLADLLLPGTDLHSPPAEYYTFRSQYSESFFQPGYYNPPIGSVDGDDVEEIPRNHDFNTDSELWMTGQLSPTGSTSSSSSSNSNSGMLLFEPTFPPNSPEQIVLRYDRNTCGILSVKDGPTENPWRTLIWPLARETPALYHAIASMTSFHHSVNNRPMRVQGLEHMRTSIQKLSKGIQNMKFDAAIATTLVLAFAESWDTHICSGIDHIKGAKILVNQALARHRQTPLAGDELTRLKFLCNTWIYMDVIARLTSVDEDESNDVERVASLISASAQDPHLDPLMGSAGRLFPLVGRVANLVRRVRKTDSNGPSIISQAIGLKAQLDSWSAPDDIVDPEDPTTSIADSKRTAEAYRYATLLYLHQAVPEVPSLPSAMLAKKALSELTLVDTNSRAVIVQIYPLTAAACEVEDEDDREWIRGRWNAMAGRMKLGIIDRCREVVDEVWKRRDAYAAEKAKAARRRSSLSSSSPSLKRGCPSEGAVIDEQFNWMELSAKRRAVGGIGAFDTPRLVPVKAERGELKNRTELDTEILETEYTVRGKLHWLSVMQDWKWEILLG
ncbi:uncharacterized protein BDZ99DRAFT_387453 [Mytilinidion resinicola]|uniref:Zn(2)-C6 fungal-type domain-containing protein n=1 Tax=Mytilinidion resinicola TaxID=574789 RepID=A0A6A6YN13_9PEZI|nr:uncharacterized protein BDZ99DRAFT_387453 [Mytilinidion resinicola]KAF2809949.1 hypothetical protein BDZ99DRAFT_387453 [Mytilinidion resinicola]